MAGLRLVTLDVTNTVLRVAGSVGTQYAKVAAEFGVKADAKELDAVFPDCFGEQMSRLPAFGAVAGVNSEAWWAEVVKNTFARAGVSGNTVGPISEALYRRFQEPSAWDLLPGAEQAVRGLRDLGLTVAVISNFDKRLPVVLGVLGLAPLLDAVVTSEEARCQKPDPAMFRLALTRTGFGPEQALHVGDSYSRDYLGSRGAGMAALLISPSPHPQVPPEEQVTRLLDVVDKAKGRMT